jgi:hypothetical protein
MRKPNLPGDELAGLVKDGVRFTMAGFKKDKISQYRLGGVTHDELGDALTDTNDGSHKWRPQPMMDEAFAPVPHESSRPQKVHSPLSLDASPHEIDTPSPRGASSARHRAGPPWRARTPDKVGCARPAPAPAPTESIIFGTLVGGTPLSVSAAAPPSTAAHVDIFGQKPWDGQSVRHVCRLIDN